METILSNDPSPFQVDESTLTARPGFGEHFKDKSPTYWTRAQQIQNTPGLAVRTENLENPVVKVRA